MFTDIQSFLSYKSECLTSNVLISVTESKADSSFLLHHFLSFYLNEGCKIVLLSFSQSFNHFSSVGHKIGNNLVQARDQKQFLFIEGLKYLARATNSCLKGDNPWTDCFLSDGTFNVKQFYDILMKTVNQFNTENNKNVVLVIDNVSILMDIGAHRNNVIALLHYLKTFMCTKLGGCLVVALNNDLCDDDEESALLKKYLQHSVDLGLDVRGLETGYCKDVHGQLTASRYNSVSREKTVTKTTQYKLTDKTCALFASGMSSAVL